MKFFYSLLTFTFYNKFKSLLFLLTLTILDINAQVVKNNINISDNFQVIYIANKAANITVSIKVSDRVCPAGRNFIIKYDGYLTDKDLFIKFKITYLDCNNSKRQQTVSLPIGKRDLDFSAIWGDKGKNRNIYERNDDASILLGTAGNSYDNHFIYYPGSDLGVISDIELTTQYYFESKKVDQLEAARSISVLNVDGSKNSSQNKAIFGSKISLTPIDGNLLPNAKWVWYDGNFQPVYTGSKYEFTVTDSIDYIDLYVRAEENANKTTFTRAIIWLDFTNVLTDRANKYFKAKNYTKAKEIYLEILKKSNSTSYYASNQLDLCNQYISADKTFKYSETFFNSNSLIKSDIGEWLETESNKANKGSIKLDLKLEMNKTSKLEFINTGKENTFRSTLLKDYLNSRAANYAQAKIKIANDYIPVNAEEIYPILFEWNTIESTCFKSSRGTIIADSALNDKTYNEINQFREYIFQKSDLKNKQQATYQKNGNIYIVSNGEINFYYEYLNNNYYYLYSENVVTSKLPLSFLSSKYPNGTYSFSTKNKNLNGKYFKDLTLKGKYFNSGPSNVLLSMLMPGVGNKHVSTNYKNGKRITKSFVTFSILAIAAKKYSDFKYAEYVRSTDQTSMERNYYHANLSNKLFLASASIAATIYISDIAYVFFKGKSNKKKFNSLNVNNHQTVVY